MNKEDKINLKFWDRPVGTVILFVILILIGVILTGIITIFTSEMSPVWKSLCENYIPVALLGIVFVLYMLIKDKASLETMLPHYGNNKPKSFLWGLLIGFLCNVGLILLAVAVGNIKLSYSGMGIGLFIISFVIVSAQCIGEEILTRVFLYQRFKRSNGTLFAIIMNATVFSALHITNMFTYDVQPMYAIFGLLNTLLLGVYFAEVVYYKDNVWYAFAFHAAWNFSQNFLLGLPNSGMPATESVFRLADEGVDSIIYSTKYGVEATIGTTIVLAALMVITYVRGKKRVLKLFK